MANFSSAERFLCLGLMILDLWSSISFRVAKVSKWELPGGGRCVESVFRAFEVKSFSPWRFHVFGGFGSIVSTLNNCEIFLDQCGCPKVKVHQVWDKSLNLPTEGFPPVL